MPVKTIFTFISMVYGDSRGRGNPLHVIGFIHSLKSAVFKLTMPTVAAQMNEFPTMAAIGRRIQAAREAAGLTQAQLAERLGIASHQSISELEQGHRRLQPAELVKLTEVLHRDMDYFIDPFSTAEEAQFSWRSSPDLPEGGTGEFAARADRLVALLRWLRLSDEEACSPLKPMLRLSEKSSFEAAEQAGERLAEFLELGAVPAEKLLEKIEQKLDIPVLYVDMAGGISGVTVHLPDFTCILINRKEPAVRRAFDLAHELFHALTWEAMPPKRVEVNTFESAKSGKKSRVEQLADKFAAALLMPRAALEHKWKSIDASKVDELQALAAYFGVSPIALAWRLFGLRWINSKAVDALKATHSAEPPGNGQPKLYSAKFVSLLARALRDGRLSPRKAAKLLELNLDALDELFNEYGLSTPY